MLVTVDSKSLTGDEVTFDDIWATGYTCVPIGLSTPVTAVREMHLRKASLPCHQGLIVSEYNDWLTFWDAATGNTTQHTITIPNDIDNLTDLAVTIAGLMNVADPLGAWVWTYSESNNQIHVQNGGAHVHFDLRRNPLSFILGWPADTAEDRVTNDQWLLKACPFAERSTLYLSFDEIEMDHNTRVNALGVPNIFCTLFVEAVGENAYIDPDSDFQLPSDFIVVQPTQVPTVVLREANLSFTHLTPRFWVMCGSTFVPYNLNSMHFCIELFIHTSQSKNENSMQGQYY